MKDIIVIAIIVIIGAVVMISAIPVERESKRRLQRYWNRMCTGKEWRRRFPDATKDEIRRFLETFVDGFTFQSSQRLKFEPNDKVMDIYRALYPSTGWPDASEVETFARNLKREYAFDLAKVEDPHVTLGQLFMMIRNPNQRRHPTALIAPLVRRNVRHKPVPLKNCLVDFVGVLRITAAGEQTLHVGCRGPVHVDQLGQRAKETTRPLTR
ncbi:MAG TPA: hypothetical protein PLG22_12390 [Kiritimatiellia bacterium]|nr:hypothetical protein [Kiritimatiellia bacterium]